MNVLQGTGVSGGIAAGPLYVYCHNRQKIEKRSISDIHAEQQLFERARCTAVQQLEEIRQKDNNSAELLLAHQMMLEDADFIDSVNDIIEKEHVCAVYAVSETGKKFAKLFVDMDDSYMQARAADVNDAAARVIACLTGTGSRLHIDTPVLLAADDLAPSETVQLDRTKILGFVTSGGAPQGHTAILARTMGIPAVIGVGAVHWEDIQGTFAVMDGDTGEVVIEPDAQTRGQMEARQKQQRTERQQAEHMRGKETVTADGKKIMLYCNIGSPADIDAVLANDGGGIGLFRSEFLYLEREDYPTEQQLFEAYREAAQRMDGKRVIIRTLDIGADKQAAYFGLQKEENPAMGLRAVRLCLTRPEICRTQLRALYRASAYGSIAILFPMIASVWEVQEMKRMCEEVKQDLDAEHIGYDASTELGIMIETPAAVMLADRLAREVDFFSIGTNDLTQYTLAADRQNEQLGRFFDAHHPAVLRMIHRVAEQAHKAGIWVGICGELAADRTLTETFLALGIDELSVSPTQVLPLRAAIRAVHSAAHRETILHDLMCETE